MVKEFSTSSLTRSKLSVTAPRNRAMDTTPTLTASEVIDRVQTARTFAHQCEVEQIELAVQWALLHPCHDAYPAGWHDDRGLFETGDPLAGPGAPLGGPGLAEPATLGVRCEVQAFGERWSHADSVAGWDHGRMDSPAVTPPVSRLSMVGQLYVTTVGAVALLSLLAESPAWHVALVVLTLPLSLLALWIGYYGGLAVSLVTGTQAGELSWPVVVVWVAVWTMTAWLNAQVAQKVFRVGWRAVPARRLEEELDD
jgi:hypothetical protein